MDVRRHNLLGGGRQEGYIFRNRGVSYADGVVYVAGGSFLFALDAKTGKPIPGFGKNGQASVILDVLKTRYPDVKTAISMGYWFTTAPQVHNGVLYIGSTRSESHIRVATSLPSMRRPARCSGTSTPCRRTRRIRAGRLPVRRGSAASAMAAESGKRRPSIPSWGCFTSRSAIRSATAGSGSGKNLFTDSIIALALDTGKLAWYFQQTHHDVWDYDSGGPPILFDMQVQGRRVKAVAEASKNGYLYILNRETGEPVHPIKEMPVPTETTLQGEQPWPTQPIPHTARESR